jgi:hypothetical protein
MTDVWFIVAGWGVILGGLALYGLALLRRLHSARARAESPTADDHAPGGRE